VLAEINTVGNTTQYEATMQYFRATRDLEIYVYGHGLWEGIFLDGLQKP
jgi:hypothetical protein